MSIKISGKGSYVSIDFDTEKLKVYYPKHYTNAYRDVKDFFVKNGFIHLKDTNYLGENISKFRAILLFRKFASNNKWVALCLNKFDILEFNGRWRAKDDIVATYTDIAYKREMEQKHNTPKTMSMAEWKAAIAEKRAESLNEHRNVQKSKSFKEERD